MSVFFNYSNPICIQGQTKCTFSLDPSIASLKELLMYELKQIAYYIIKLDELSIDTKEIRNKVIYYISLLVIILDFKREEFQKLILEVRENKKEIENKYLEICNQQNLPYQPLKPFYDLSSDKPEIVKLINEGEKQSLLKNTILSKTKKNVYEIMINLIQTCCLCLSETNNHGVDDVEGKMAVIKLLNITNFPTIPDEKWIAKTNEFSKISFRVLQELKDLTLNVVPIVEEKIVDVTIKKGPAILVSGHFVKDLIALLEATKNEGVNVYTHNGMILVHSHSAIKNYPHLIGHYQLSNNETSQNFESFPGPILMTKNSQPNSHLIRGRIFTIDDYPGYGFSKIKNYDFSELIRTAKESEGFDKDMELTKLKVGFNKEETLNKLKDICTKIKSGEIKHLFIVDILNQYPHKNEYLEKFFKLIPDDYFVISLSYPSNKKNIWHIDSYYDYSMIYLILSELTDNFDMGTLNITVVFTQCTMLTISYILNLKSTGIHSFYLGNCCPLTTNPSLIEGLCDLFGVQYMTDDPAKDFENLQQM